MIHILVIDDSRSVHAYLDSILGILKNIHLTHSMDGSEGVKQFKESIQSYDLILLDWEMPVLSGPEVLEVAKSDGWETPIIMMTSKNKPEEIIKMLDQGAKEYMMKPFTSEIIFEKIEMVLGVSCEGLSS
jgi:two-component system, chemotaxis family, chemotaxis protein CheY